MSILVYELSGFIRDKTYVPAVVAGIVTVISPLFTKVTPVVCVIGNAEPPPPIGPESIHTTGEF